MTSKDHARSTGEGGGQSPLNDSPDGSNYAAQLERVTRGLLAVSLAVVSQMEQRVSTTHLRALQALARLGSCKVGELAEAVDLAPSSTSRLSDRLAEAGLITRSVSPDNRRATRLDLTPAGRGLVEELIRVRTETFRYIVEYMSEQDRKALLRGSQAFTEACLAALRHTPTIHLGDHPGVSLTEEMCSDPPTEV
jgi:DNA-binding MarR family transcriptional regulator